MIDYSRVFKAVERDVDPIDKSVAEFQQQIPDPSLKSTLSETAKKARDLVEKQLDPLERLRNFEVGEYLQRAMDEKTVSAEKPATTTPPMAPSV